MHTFKKLALAAAIASTPMFATALQPLDDITLAGVTGQDGISINLEANLSVDVAIEDTSGAELAGGVYTANGGFITLAGLGIATGGENITIDIDAGSSNDGSGSGVLVVGVHVDEVTISNIDVGVSGSSLAQDGGTNANVVPAGARDSATGLERAHTAVANNTSIVKIGDISLNDLNLNIELGPEASQFLRLSTAGALDIEINDFELSDPTGGGKLAVESILVAGIDLDAAIAITTNGLVATVGPSSMDVAMMGVSPGSGTIGNLYLLNLNMADTEITISGR